MKVFIDIGGNRGQTVGAIFEPTYGFDLLFCKYEFDRIYCFEPVVELRQEIAEKYSDPRITSYAFGLWKETCEKPIYSPGTQSGSIFADKINVDPHDSVMCQFVRASDWFRDHLTDADEVYLKLNCEGCEADILEDLLDSNEYRKIKSLCVAFDIRKIPSQRHRETEIKRRLAESGYENYIDLNTIAGESHREVIQNWLSGARAEQFSWANRIGKLVYDGRIFAARAARYARRRIIG